MNHYSSNTVYFNTELNVFFKIVCVEGMEISYIHESANNEIMTTLLDKSSSSSYIKENVRLITRPKMIELLYL